MSRAKLDTDDLLRLVLALLVVYLILKVLDLTLSLLGGLLGVLLEPAVVLIIAVVLVLWYTDRI